MARKSTMVTSIDEIVGWNKMADGRILSNEEFDGENGHPVYLLSLIHISEPTRP